MSRQLQPQPQLPRPPGGGRYVRDPKTGALSKVHGTQPQEIAAESAPAAPATPATLEQPKQPEQPDLSAAPDSLAEPLPASLVQHKPHRNKE